MDKNNIYNFRNPVRHFLNINKVLYERPINNIVIKDLSWSQPINFRIRKNENKYRSLKMPNILNFMRSFEEFKESDNFDSIERIDENKRLVPNLDTGDFATGIFDIQLEEDFQKLCLYQNLLKLDIKAYYDRIYAHDLEFEKKGQENFLTNLNNGNTNGLIMGNYISLYFAEKYLKKISDKLKDKIENSYIDCEFSYFSDDFYFFCNKSDNNKVINLFDTVLEEFNLERNDDDIEIWDYLSYNEYNLIEKYWKKIISECKVRYNKENNTNKLYFTNQLIYRLSNLKDYKSKRTFLIGFFKANYFCEFDPSKYIMEDYNFHQICYIFSFAPEVMLYAIDKFSNFDQFRQDKFKMFLKTKYQKALDTYFNDEQMYYFFAIKLLNFDSILEQTKDQVLKSKNQLLISYYLVDNLFEELHISLLKQKKDERFWFQNYHLIMCTDLNEDIDENIKEYLIPTYATNQQQIKTYTEFYKLNIENKILFINDINNVQSNINEYLNSKVEERIEVFGIDEE